MKETLMSRLRSALLFITYMHGVGVDKLMNLCVKSFRICPDSAGFLFDCTLHVTPDLFFLKDPLIFHHRKCLTPEMCGMLLAPSLFAVETGTYQISDNDQLDHIIRVTFVKNTSKYSAVFHGGG